MNGSSGLVLNLVVGNAIEAIRFYEKVFGAIRGDVFEFPGKTGCNEVNLTIGGVGLRIMDENDAYDCHPPKEGVTDSIWLQLMVDDVTDTLQKARDNGAVINSEPGEFMGTLHAHFTDPFRYVWTVYKELKKISFEERYRIYEELNNG